MACQSAASPFSFVSLRKVQADMAANPFPQGPFNDDQPLGTSVGANPTPSLLLECIPGITQQRIGDKTSEFDGLIKISTRNDAGAVEYPVDFVVVLDVSVSMKGEKLSQLKQSMHWLIGWLSEHHRMSIITFRHIVERKTPLMAMNAAGKARLTEVIDELVAEGATDMMGALNLATQVILDRTYSEGAAMVMLITDGRDSFDSSYSDAFPAISRLDGKATFACLGLGENCDAKFLSKLSQLSGGEFDYCASPGQIATTISTFAGTATRAVAKTLHLVIETGCEKKELKIPIFSAGQEHFYTFRAKVSPNPYLSASLTYKIPGSTQEIRIVLKGDLSRDRFSPADATTLITIDAHKNRKLAAETWLKSAELSHTEAAELIENLMNTLQHSLSAHHLLSKQLMAECTVSLEKLREQKALSDSAARSLSLGIGER